MDEKARTTVSKFLSFVLRHRPDAVSVTLDQGGWVDVELLLRGCADMLGCDYRESTKRNMPRSWFDDLPHTHVALDDALGQGALFCNMLQEARRGGERS